MKTNSRFHPSISLLTALLVPSLCHTRILPGAPIVVLADETAVKSQIAGIALPKGATRLNELSGKFARLLSAAGAEVKLPPVQGDAEVLLWNTNAGRGPFVRSAMEAALRGAGYEVQEKSSDDIYKTNPFEYELDGDPIHLSSIDQTGYFTATNAAKKQSILAGWILGDKRIIIALAPLGFKPDAPKAPLPSVTGAHVLLVKDINDAMKGIAPPPAPAILKLSPRPGMVCGVVKDAAGKSIVGAQIVAQTSALGGLFTDSRTRTNAQGLYKLPLPAGVSQVVNADCTIHYNGRSYLLPLRPVDGECEHFNSKDGHVENFSIRTYGVADVQAERSPSEGAYYYGGSIRVFQDNEVAPGGTVEITLQPQGALLDGSRGRTLVFRYPSQGMGETFLNDVPLGRYQMSSRLLDGGEALPLRLRPTFGNDEPKARLQVDFEPVDGPLATLGRSGVKRFNVTIQP